MGLLMSWGYSHRAALVSDRRPVKAVIVGSLIHPVSIELVRQVVAVSIINWILGNCAQVRGFTIFVRASEFLKSRNHYIFLPAFFRTCRRGSIIARYFPHLVNGGLCDLVSVLIEQRIRTGNLASITFSV
jgi:hypothetical protein